MGAVAAIGGALIQGSAAKKAAKAQERAANQDIAFQKETRDIIRGDLSTYREGGNLAQMALDYELGLRGRPVFGGTPLAIETIAAPVDATQTRPDGVAALMGNNSVGSRSAFATGGAAGASGAGTRYRVNGQMFNTLEEAQAYANANATGGQEYGGFTKTPGYDFRLKTGMDALQSSAAARGGLYSGAAMRDALQYGQDYGSNEYGNYLARLGARADTGMNAAQMSGQASQQAAAGVSNALGNIGNARAAGAIGVGNAWTGGIQNMLGAWQYQKNMNPGGGGGFFGGGNLFGGNSWGA